MKVFLWTFFLINSSIFASNECFKTDQSLSFYDLPRIICINNISANISPFEKSYVSLELNKASRKYEIKSLKKIDDKKLQLSINLIDYNKSQACDESFGLTLSAQLTVSHKGDFIYIDKIIGRSRYSYDICHSNIAFDDIGYYRIKPVEQHF